MSGVTVLDVQVACTRILYGPGVAQGLIAAGTADTVLVIGTDALWLRVARTTPRTCLSGAGAVLLRTCHGKEADVPVPACWAAKTVAGT